MFILSMVVLIFGIVAIISVMVFHVKWLYTVYAGLAALLFMFYLAIDIQVWYNFCRSFFLSHEKAWYRFEFGAELWMYWWNALFVLRCLWAGRNTKFLLRTTSMLRYKSSWTLFISSGCFSHFSVQGKPFHANSLGGGQVFSICFLFWFENFVTFQERRQCRRSRLPWTFSAVFQWPFCCFNGCATCAASENLLPFLPSGSKLKKYFCSSCACGWNFLCCIVFVLLLRELFEQKPWTDRILYFRD